MKYGSNVRAIKRIAYTLLRLCGILEIENNRFCFGRDCRRTGGFYIVTKNCGYGLTTVPSNQLEIVSKD